MPRREVSRIQRLEGRVGWLDRHRRAVALVATAVLMPLMMIELSDALGVDWPQMHIGALAFVIGIAVWYAVEVGLAWIMALWETEHSRLLRDRGLPRAILRRRKL
jgi:hypothetical protein